MKTALFPLLLLFIINASAQIMTKTEILGRPTDKSITLAAFFDEQVEMKVNYGLSPGELANQSQWQTTQSDGQVNILLSDLLPNTRYYYQSSFRKSPNDDIKKRPVFTFHTQRSIGEKFTFIVQADPHLDEMSDTALYRRCLRNQLEEGADFMIDLGDIIMTDKLKNAGGKITRDTIIKRCEYMREYYTTACHSLPLFIALGNHEGEAGWQLTGNSENIAVWNTLERKKYFNNPFPNDFYSGDNTNHEYVGQRENYYAWTWGDALFIVLDPYWYTQQKPGANTGWNWTLGKKQYDWLKTTLEQSNAKYKFLFSHQLVGGDPMGRGGVEFAQWYEWGGYNKDGSFGFSTQRPGWYKPIKDLLSENKVSIFFHGHDHFFGKQEKDCLIYQECPQPSLPNFTAANQADDYGYVNGLILPNAGHLRVTVSPEETKVEYIRAYLPQNENTNRKNKDVSATYYVKNQDCYDTLSTGITPVIWNSKYQNDIVFPNPYHEETMIKFTMKESSHVTLILFDAFGNKVKTLLNDNLIPEGEFQIYLDDINTNPILPPGTYFYQLSETKGKTISGKVLKI
jgi:predicted phosphodiesterase